MQGVLLCAALHATGRFVRVRIAMVGPRSGCCAAGEASLASGAAPASMATGGAAAIGPPSLAGGATAGGAPHAQTKAEAASHRERDVMSMAR